MTVSRSRADLDRGIERIRGRFSGQLALAAKNLETGEEILVDADTLYPTASVIKLAILAEVWAQVAEGRLRLNDRLEMAAGDRAGGSGILKVLGGGLQPTIYDIATLMIVLSDNTATNMLIDRVGGVEVVNRRMQGEYGLSSIALHNRVDFEKIGNDVRRFAEATSVDLMRFMERLVRGEIVSRSASNEMLEVLGRQQYLDQVPRYLNFSPYAQELKITQDINVACKTGFFPGTRVDAGALFLPDGVTIAYCAGAHNSADMTIAPESEAAVVNGLLGKALVEYWWPRDDRSSATLATCYGGD